MSAQTGNCELQEIADILDGVDDIVICGHVSPDGDCIGAGLGLGAALRLKGKRVTCLLARDEAVDCSLGFLPGVADMVPAAKFDGAMGAFVAVDVPTADRMGESALKLHAKAPVTITLDHHPASRPMSQTNYVDTDSPAAALIVWNLTALMGIERNADIATCCYTGLVTDTGRFQYQNTNPESFAAASAMITCGANPSDVAQHVYQNRSVASLELEMHLLQNMEFYGEGAYVVSFVTLDDFKKAGALKPDAEPLIDVLRSVRGVKVACVLREQDGSVRGSLRAKDDTDVSAIAQKIGGGGHRAAAGFTFKGTMDGARACIAEVYRKLAGE